MQIFGETNKEHYGMLWYFLEWSIAILPLSKRSGHCSPAKQNTRYCCRKDD